jgi:hypothetical protein
LWNAGELVAERWRARDLSSVAYQQNELLERRRNEVVEHRRARVLRSVV